MVVGAKIAAATRNPQESHILLEDGRGSMIQLSRMTWTGQYGLSKGKRADH